MSPGPISPRAPPLQPRHGELPNIALPVLKVGGPGAADWRRPGRPDHGSPRRRCNDDSESSAVPVAEPGELPQLHDARGGGGTLAATQLRLRANVGASDNSEPFAPLEARPQRSRPGCRGVRHEVACHSNDDVQKGARGHAMYASPDRTVKPAQLPAAPPVAASCSAAGADCGKPGLREACSDKDVGELPVVVAIVAASNGFLRFQDYSSNIFRGDRKAIIEGMRKTDYRMARHRREVAREAGVAARRQVREASTQRQLQRSQPEAEGREKARSTLFAAASKVQTLIKERYEKDKIRAEDEKEEEEEDEFAVEVMAGRRRPKAISTKRSGEMMARKGRPKSFSPTQGGEQDLERERRAKPDAAHNPKDSPMCRRRSASAPPLELGSPPRSPFGVRLMAQNSLEALLEGPASSSLGVKPFSISGLQRLRSIKLHSDRKQRMKALKKNTKEYVECQRKDRATQKRQMAYDQLPELQKVALQKAFNVATADSELHDAEGASFLDHRTLRIAMKEFGLGCETDAEVKAMGELCTDIALLRDVDFLTFCCDAVPRVREEIQIMRRPGLRQTFQFFDADRSGVLDREEVEKIFESLCFHNMTAAGRMHLWSVFNDAIDAITGPGCESIGFEGFETLMMEMQEHCRREVKDVQDAIVSECGLSKEEVREHDGELLSLYDTFTKVSRAVRGARPPDVGEEPPCGSDLDKVDDEGVRSILLEYGLMYSSETKFQTVSTRGWLGDVLFSHGGSISFRQVLEVIRQRREEIKFSMTSDLQDMLHEVDKDNSGTLNMQEVFLLLEIMGFPPRCREDQRRLQRLLEEVDKDKSGSLDYAEFENLVMRLMGRKANDARVRAVKAVEELGFTERDEMQLRDLFFILDDRRTKSLDVTAIRPVADRLHIEITPDALRGLVRQFSEEGSRTEVDLAGFMRVFRQLTSGQPAVALKKIFSGAT